jgi:hypothetical protein
MELSTRSVVFPEGLTTYVKDGILCYEYNLFEIERTSICTTGKIATGRDKIVVETTTHSKPKPEGSKSPYQSATIVVSVNGNQVAKGGVPLLATLLFIANDCLDFGTDQGSPVSMAYFSRTPTLRLAMVEAQALNLASSADSTAYSQAVRCLLRFARFIPIDNIGELPRIFEQLKL